MTRPIRVLHILQRMEAGGTQALLMNLYRNIDRTKVQFDFLVHYEEEQFYDEEIRQLGGRLYKLSVREDFNFIKYWKDLNKFFKEHQEYKIIHTHMYTLGAIYLLAAKRNNIPIRIAHSHEKGAERDLKFFIKRIMARLYSRYATDLFACSIDAGKYLFPNQEFRLLKNAINTENFMLPSSVREEIRKTLNIDNKLVIGHVGRFQTAKNHNFLIDIFSEIIQIRSDAILLLIGSGDLEEKIRHKVCSLKLQDNVLFLGNRRDVNKVYQAMDTFILPSLNEGLGIVAIEAQAAGIPILCSDTVPLETKLTDLVEYMSLDVSAEIWAQHVIERCTSIKKVDNLYETIVSAGYDMETVSLEMQQYYLMMHKLNS